MTPSGFEYCDVPDCHRSLDCEDMFYQCEERKINDREAGCFFFSPYVIRVMAVEQAASIVVMT